MSDVIHAAGAIEYTVERIEGCLDDAQAWVDEYVAPVEQEIILARSADRKIEQNVMVYVMFIQVGGKPVETRAFAQLNA